VQVALVGHSKGNARRREDEYKVKKKKAGTLCLTLGLRKEVTLKEDASHFYSSTNGKI